MWDEKGRRIMSIRFEAGEPVELVAPDAVLQGQDVVCTYSDKKLSSGSPESCIPYEDVKAGIPSIRPRDQPEVPPDRDPRGKP